MMCMLFSLYHQEKVVNIVLKDANGLTQGFQKVLCSPQVPTPEEVSSTDTLIVGTALSPEAAPAPVLATAPANCSNNGSNNGASLTSRVLFAGSPCKFLLLRFFDPPKTSAVQVWKCSWH